MSEVPTEYVYLIGGEGSPIVKIGRSIDVPGRLAAIQYMSPLKLAVLWQTEGGAELEAALHRWFKSQRSHGEWFDFPDGDAVGQVAQAVLDIAVARRAARKARKLRSVWRAPRPKQQTPQEEAPRPLALRGSGITSANQIATYFRQAIWGGQYQCGDKLPRAVDVAAELGMDRKTVLESYKQLATERLIEVKRRGGTTVIGESKPVIQLDGYIEWGCKHLEIYAPANPQPRRVPASEEVAAELGIPAGTEIIEETELPRDTNGRPTRAITTWRLVDAPGGQLEASEEMWSRLPLPAEMALLELSSYLEPVVELTRRVHADGHPIGFTRCLYVGRSFSLTHTRERTA
jgi:DNA-binding GntR family transcriptional regulator